jgi:hypothetical protein
MKYFKYIGIVLAVAAMIYTKTKMDERNKKEVQTMEDLDKEEGFTTPAPAPAPKKK